MQNNINVVHDPMDSDHKRPKHAVSNKINGALSKTFVAGDVRCAKFLNLRSETAVYEIGNDRVESLRLLEVE
jgi:hypothetical protein